MKKDYTPNFIIEITDVDCFSMLLTEIAEKIIPIVRDDDKARKIWERGIIRFIEIAAPDCSKDTVFNLSLKLHHIMLKKNESDYLANLEEFHKFKSELCKLIDECPERRDYDNGVLSFCRKYIKECNSDTVQMIEAHCRTVLNTRDPNWDGL